MKKEEGFTFLEVLFVMGMIVILIGMSVHSFIPYMVRNRALQIRSEAELALDVSNAYLLSTSHYQKSTLIERLSSVLDGYQVDVPGDNYYEIKEVTDIYGVLHITLVIHSYVNDSLTIKSELKPQDNTIKLKGIGDVNHITSLIESGVLDE